MRSGWRMWDSVGGVKCCISIVAMKHFFRHAVSHEDHIMGGPLTIIERLESRIQFAGGNARLRQRSPRDGQEIAQMLARREFRHDAAVFGVQLDLGGNDVRKHPAVVDHGGAGFVARSLESEQQHGRCGGNGIRAWSLHVHGGAGRGDFFGPRRRGIRRGALREQQDSLEHVQSAIQLRVAEFLDRLAVFGFQ